VRSRNGTRVMFQTQSNCPGPARRLSSRLVGFRHPMQGIMAMVEWMMRRRERMKLMMATATATTMAGSTQLECFAPRRTRIKITIQLDDRRSSSCSVSIIRHPTAPQQWWRHRLEYRRLNTSNVRWVGIGLPWVLNKRFFAIDTSTASQKQRTQCLVYSDAQHAVENHLHIKFCGIGGIFSKLGIPRCLPFEPKNKVCAGLVPVRLITNVGKAVVCQQPAYFTNNFEGDCRLRLNRISTYCGVPVESPFWLR